MSETQDQIALQETPIRIEQSIGAIGDSTCGGVVIFLGATRAEHNAGGKPLLALDYEAYPEMALNQLRELATDARSRWHIGRVVLLHRLGRVAVGEPSVLIAVSTPHRKEAFEACEFLIDTLKAKVAIWKKEVWEGGGTSWVHPDQPPSPD